MRKQLFPASLLLLVAAVGFALAQSPPGLKFGDVLTAAEWNALFVAKQDTLGYVPLNSAGGTMTGPLITAPSNTAAAGLNCPQGAAPTSPNNGDVWCTSAGMYVQINGATVGPLSSNAAWTPYTATLVPGSGSITTQTSASAYQQVGKTVTVRVSMTINAVGTASGSLTFNFPVMPAVTQLILGRETNVNGNVLASHVQSGTLASSTISIYSGGATSVDNAATYEFTGTYEAN